MIACPDKNSENVPPAAGSRLPVLLYLPFAVLVYGALHVRAITDPNWVPFHDTLTQLTEFLYAVSAFRNGELPLWNSYLYGGQPFYLLLTHGLLLNPIMWLWMMIGSLLRLSELHIFVFYHLTEAAFFSFGGFLLVRQITKQKVPAVAAFIILLFSGEAAYWPNQIYSLSVVLYVPWILFFVLRYVEEQTLLNALPAGIFFAISANVYYPVYLIAFSSVLLIATCIVYFDRIRAFNYKKAAGHALLVLPLTASLLLPTYLSYLEISSENYQISRFDGPEQTDKHAAPNLVSTEAMSKVQALVPSLFRVTKNAYVESVPLVGALALTLASFALLSGSRYSLYWSIVLLMMCLHYVGPGTPFHFLNYHLVPYYKVLRTYGFFSGFITLSITVLAGIGINQIMMLKPGDAHARWRALIVFSACVGLVAAFPADNRWASFLAVLFLGLLAVLKTFPTKGQVARLFSHLLLAGLVFLGVFNLAGVRKAIYLNLSAKMFSYDDRFGFSSTRPDRYTIKQLNVFLNNDSECCSTFYHLAEKIDAPDFFGIWGSPHTLFVNRDYYRYSSMPGFAGFMKNKFYFFRNYMVGDGVIDYADLLRKSVLVLNDDRFIRNRSAKLNPSVLDALPARQAYSPVLTVVRKTANTVSVMANAETDMFLLYTDLFHSGFRASIDGRSVPVLRGMGTFKAVEMPAGKHLIEFSFHPAYAYALLFYLVVSICFLVALPLHGIFSAVRCRKGGQPSQ